MAKRGYSYDFYCYKIPYLPIRGGKPLSFEAHEKAQSILVVTSISHYRAPKLLQINTTLLSSLFWSKKLAWPEHIPCQRPASASLS